MFRAAKVDLTCGLQLLCLNSLCYTAYLASQGNIIIVYCGQYITTSLITLRFYEFLLMRKTSFLSLKGRIATAIKSLQSCLTLCDPIDGSPPGSPISGILQARILEWVAISFSNAWKWKVKVKSLSRVQLLATPWMAAYQAPPSMGFSRQEYWSG